jgi:hypothetical protein
MSRRYEVQALVDKLVDDLRNRLRTKAIWAQVAFHKALDKHEQVTEEDLAGLMASIYAAYDRDHPETIAAFRNFLVKCHFWLLLDRIFIEGAKKKRRF